MNTLICTVGLLRSGKSTHGQRFCGLAEGFDLTEEELDKRISEVLDQYSPILDGVEHEELKTKVREAKPSVTGRSLPKSTDIELVDDYDSSSESSSSSSSSES